MKQGKRIIWKGVCYFFILLFLLLLAYGIWYGIKGYRMYRNAVTEITIAEQAAIIEQQEHYVRYEELPQQEANTILVEKTLSE